jgi:hypothetical protein
MSAHEDPEEHGAVGIGDRVRILASDLTANAGIAGRVGVVFGWTTPSMEYGAEILGDTPTDIAINVNLEGSSDPAASVWLAPEHVELVEHRPGLESERRDS